MCIFHVSSKSDSFKQFLATYPDLPVYQAHEKGDIPKIKQDEQPHEDYGFSCEVSDREWSDMEGQIVDMISFLEVYTPYLQQLKDSHNIDDWRFDLPYESLLSDERFTQFDYLPPKLMRLAGALEIGIELSLYAPSPDEDVIDEDDLANADSDH